MRSSPSFRSVRFRSSLVLVVAATALTIAACSGNGLPSIAPETGNDSAADGGDASSSVVDGGAISSDASHVDGAVSCDKSRADCNKNANDGCEIDLSSNPSNCGACGKTCQSGEVCGLGQCSSACPSTLTNCANACVDTSISVDHCGGCNKPCSAPANATAICESSLCGFECNSGYEKCGAGSSCCPKTTPSPPTLQPGSSLAAGSNHSCAISTSGALKCWGSNGSGKLGDDTTDDHSAAVSVQGLAAGAVAVGCGDIHTCALLSNGSVSCWGGNNVGQLGDGSNAGHKTANPVSGLGSGVIALAVGKEFACAIVAGGNVKCWGANDVGQLGDDSNDEADTPVDVTALPHPALALAAGATHMCALLDDGSVYCWGSNDRGQLGDGTVVERDVPTAVASLPTNVVAISAGFSHTCVRTADKKVLCWGSDGSGQLGDGSGNDSYAPVEATNVTDAVALDLGSFHTCSIASDGTAMCWGLGTSGQLGDGTTTSHALPAPVTGLVPVLLTDVAGGAAHTCARTQGGNVKCWGANSRGQLGNGTTNQSTTPVSVQGL